LCPTGFSGLNCETKSKLCDKNLNPCQYNGNCTLDSSVLGYSCSCEITRTGPNCEYSIMIIKNI
jgi:hypothetical protein